MSMTTDLKILGASIAAMIAVAIVSVMGILVLNGFKGTTIGGTANCTLTPGASPCTINNTIDNFILGIAVVATFMEILMLVLVAVIIIKVVKEVRG